MVQNGPFSGNSPDTARTGRGGYRALLKEQKEAPDELARAKTAEERQKITARMRSLPQRFLDLAREHPKAPVAVDALVRVVEAVNGTAFPAGGKDTPGHQA